MPTQVVFLSRVEAQKLDPVPGCVIVSIHDCSEAPAVLRSGWLDRLTLEFHDTDEPQGALVAFDEAMATRVLDFIERHRGDARHIIVHCSMGVSRSAGVALALAELLALPCLKGPLPVTGLSYRLYNRRVYSTLMNRACDLRWGPRFED